MEDSLRAISKEAFKFTIMALPLYISIICKGYNMITIWNFNSHCATCSKRLNFVSTNQV